MRSLSGLIDLLNVAANAAEGGPVSISSSSLRFLVRFAAAETIVILALAAAAVFYLLRNRRKSDAEPTGTGAAAGDPVGAAEKLKRQLDEMVRTTNDRNNYINSIFSSIEDGFVLVDAENRVVLYNPRAAELLGLEPSVFFDRRASAAAAREPVSSILRSCARVTATKRTENLLLHTSAGRVLEVRVSPILDKYAGASNFGSLAVAGDVTELRKLENLRKDFVANVSHEFRTPLTLISGFTEMFKMGGSIRAADRKRAFEIIEIETERLKRLVSELLTLSEIENELPHPASAPIDAAAVIEGMVGSLGNLAERKRQLITTDLRIERGALFGNENWFYQAVKNLLENAIKYTPDGGSIRIEAYREGGELVVSVADTGIGIAPEEFERIFERFYRVEKARGSGSGGSGLGLALVKGIVSIFGGRVLVRSELGVGSVFTLRLPAASTHAAEENGGTSGFEP